MIRACKKALSLLLVVLLFFNQLIFAPAVFADVTSTSSAALASPDPSLTPSPTPTPTVTPTPKPTIAPSPSATTAATLSPVPEPTPSPVASDWQQNSDGSQTTVNNVELNKVYVAPQDGKVTVKFDKLTTPGKLTIKKVSTQNLTGVNPVSDTAYDISSGMQNGTFDYTLTLPTTKTQNVEVKASEDGKTFTTLGNVTAQTDTLTIASLNHFTLFVITGTAISSFNESSSSLIINEFLYNPTSGNEWVELYNKTGSSVDLTSWKLVDAANNVKNLSGSVPANGFYVFEAASWLNNTGQESIYLKDSGNNTIDEVTYESGSSTTIIGPQNLGGVPNGTQSVARTTDGGATWAIATPTKGWSDALSAPTAVYVNSSYVGVNTGAQNQPLTTIADAINLVATGGAVNIAAGTYALDSQIRITKGITIIGAGDSTIITNGSTPWTNNTGSKGYAPLITISGVSSPVVLQNFKVTGAANIAMTGAGAGKTDYGHGVNVVSSSNVTLNNITSVSNQAAGLIVNGSTVTATNLNTSGNGWNAAVNVDPGSGVTTPSVFTLNSGTLAESTQIWSDGSNVSGSATVSVAASGYNTYASGGSNAFIWTNRPLAYAATITRSGVSTRYTTIQSAINAAISGDTINVAAGTYAENLTINKALILVGAGQVNTTIYPAVSNPTGTNNVITIQSDNVNLHDFTINGDNPNLTSGVVIGGADIDANRGIMTDPTQNHTNLTVNNVTVKNVYLRGIQLGISSQTTPFSFNITNSTVQNVQGDLSSSVAIFNSGGSGIISGNQVSGTPDAISANHSRGTQFLNNVVTNSASGIHTDNAGDRSGISDLIQGNQISNGVGDGINPYSITGSFGIWVFAPYMLVTVNNNAITNVKNGLASFGQGASVTPVFSNNIVDGLNTLGSIGALVSTDIPQFGTSNVSTSLVGNQLKNNTSGISLQSGLGLTLSLINSINNILSGNTTGVNMITGGNYNVAINFSTFLKNTVNINNNAISTLDATNNSWDVTDIASKITGTGLVNFTPFIRNTAAVLAPTVTLDTTKTTVTVNNTTSASTINIPSNVTNPTLDVSGIATTSGGNTNATINGNITLNATTSVGTITVAIPAGITISAGASANWTGVINAPTLVNPSSVTLPSAPSGQTNTIAASVEVGFGNVPLTFNKGVRILLAGQAGKLAGYVRNGLFTAINNTCASDSQATGDALAGGECKIDVGSDMVIWTQHFTQFVSYSQNVQVSRGGGGFVSDGLGCGSHDCNTARQTPQGQVLGVTTKLASLPFESGIAEQEVQGAATTSEKVEKGEVKAASTIAPVSTPKAKTESNSKSSGPIGAIRDFFAAIVGFILRLFGK